MNRGCRNCSIRRRWHD